MRTLFSASQRRGPQKSASGKLGLSGGGLGNIVSGDFAPVLATHAKSFYLVDTLSVGVDRIQRNFEPLQRQVELWRKTQITDDSEADLLLDVCRRQAGRAQESVVRGPPAVL
jgi:hypothetical protein